MVSILRNKWHAIGVQNKLHILIQGAIIILFFVLMEWVLDRFEMQIEQAAESRAEEVADGLINGMNLLMLTGQISDPANRKLLLDKMSQSPGITELRIIRGHSVNEQYGPGLPEEHAIDDMDREVLESGKISFHRVISAEGRNGLRVVVPFIAHRDFRGTDCLSCHVTEAGAVNGAASVIIDLTEQEAQLARIKGQLWIAHILLQLLLLVIISLFVRVVIVRNISDPVKKLQNAMAKIQHDMDMSMRVDVDANNPDIGEMAKSFNVLLERLQHATDRLQLFAKMFENSGEAITITDANRNIVAVNPAFAEITGYSAEEVMGKNPKILSSGKQTPEFYALMWLSLNEIGQWRGEIWNRRKNGEIYPEWLSIGVVKSAHGEVINYISLFSDITKRKEAEQRIEFLAHYDSLTKLPNRVLFADRLARALLLANRNETKVALLFLDLDKFKSINDTLGHLVGDQLLQSVAERLKGCVRESDTICRQGGDEFLILLEDVSDVADVDGVAQKIIAAMSEAHRIGEHRLVVTFSIGAAIFPDDADNEEALVQHADLAMYRAKESGRNNFKLFNSI
ncbi:MAG: diguanylate cyclase [Gallionella sp.]|nr:diguanylate cyclase [Gallionella sp.]